MELACYFCSLFAIFKDKFERREPLRQDPASHHGQQELAWLDVPPAPTAPCKPTHASKLLTAIPYRLPARWTRLRLSLQGYPYPNGGHPRFPDLRRPRHSPREYMRSPYPFYTSLILLSLHWASLQSRCSGPDPPHSRCQVRSPPPARLAHRVSLCREIRKVVRPGAQREAPGVRSQPHHSLQHLCPLRPRVKVNRDALEARQIPKGFGPHAESPPRAVTPLHGQLPFCIG